MSKQLSRRTILRGAGAAIALPLLDAMTPSLLRAESTYKPVAESLGEHPRMICCYVPQGVNNTQWYPQDDGPDWTLTPTLEALREFKSDFTLISGLSHMRSPGGHDGADTWLTEANLFGTPGKDYHNTISVDQIAAKMHGRHTRLPSLQLATANGTGHATNSVTLSFDKHGIPLPAENRVQSVFERLFVLEGAASKKATMQRFAERRSILDNVLGEAKSLHKKLGTTDQQKLDEYLNSVRETEQRVDRLTNWVDQPKAKIEKAGLQLNADPHSDHDRMMFLDVMMELSYLAFQTDTTRVITFEWDTEPGSKGDGNNDHHTLSHHGGDATKLEGLARIDRFYIDRLAHFLSLLKRTKEADGSMLDNTMLVYGSGMNNGEIGEHSAKDLPLLVAGGAKLGLKHGKHLKHKIDARPMSDVLLTVLQKMGVETDSFSDSSGTLASLT